MRNIRVGSSLAAVAALLLVTGCSNCGIPGVDEIGSLFSDDCAPPAVADCAPPMPDPVCEPPPPVCDPAPVAEPAMAERPQNVRPGEVWCYVRVPAVTRTEEERVCVRQETCRQVHVPAVTKQVARQVCVRPASVRYEEIQPEFEERSEQVCVAQGRTEWARVGCAPTQLRPREQVGECWTLKEIPPQFQTRTERVCVRPASRREIPIEAQYETQYETVVVEPARVDQIPVPAEYETRLKEVVVCGPRWEWRRTTECEVPDAAGGFQQPAPLPQEAPGMDDNYLPQPAPVLPPADNDVPPVDNGVPPAGGLPPLR